MKNIYAVMAALLLPACICGCGCSLGGEYHAPSIGGYNIYVGHIHNHTAFSGGKGSPYDAYKYARDTARMDFLGITEHDYALDSREWAVLSTAADEYNSDGSFVTFRGFEWSSSSNYGHVSIIGTPEYVRSDNADYDTFSEMCAWITTTDGIAFFNHPGREDDNSTEFGHFLTAPVDNFCGMELWNKSEGFSTYYYNDGYTAGDGGLGYYDEALQHGWCIGASGSGDDHSATWGTAQPYRLAVLAHENTRAGILAAFRARRFYSTLDYNLSLSFKINGSEMGSVISGGTYDVVILTDDGSENDTFTAVELLKNGSVINTWSPSVKKASITLNITASPGDYYYVRVKQADGDEAVSSPVWIE